MKKKKSVTGDIADLEKILAYFEQSEIDLDEAIEKYESAISLAKKIQKHLTGYSEKVKEIKLKFDSEEQKDDSSTNQKELPGL